MVPAAFVSSSSGRCLGAKSGKHWRPRHFLQLCLFGSTNAPRQAKARTPYDTLKERGLIYQSSSDLLPTFLSKQKATVYVGVDPTAQSLHVGNLLPIVSLLHFYALGHRPIVLVGGATGSIGDPSGRRSERNTIEEEKVQQNVAAIDQQLRRVFANAKAYIDKRQFSPVPSSELPAVNLCNNLDWFRQMNILEFLRDVGKFARVSVMMSRDSVRNRIGSPEGISFTEFSYQLLQGYDFYHLLKHEQCRIQIGGSDQWGNIVAGMDLIKRLEEGKSIPDAEETMPPAFGLTVPLVTNSKGEKFGKSAGNAIWLDENLLSHFDFYQFFRRTDDADVEKYLRFFTFLSMDEIAGLMSDHRANPSKHLPQRALASNVTELVHGGTVPVGALPNWVMTDMTYVTIEQAARKSRIMSETLFDSDILAMNAGEILEAFKGDPRLVSVPAEEFVGQSIVHAAVNAKAVKSQTAAKKLIVAGGMYLNNVKVTQADRVLSRDDLLDGVVCLLRTGKQNQTVVELRQ
ncbi:tyrosine-tRNA ligase [Phlyctochytrium arcticum]|nr:tyrosine-tRNA ligase [Phlyctochytrium arcticum]